MNKLKLWIKIKIHWFNHIQGKCSDIYCIYRKGNAIWIDTIKEENN